METKLLQMLLVRTLIQSDRYGMETSSRRLLAPFAGFNRTDTEWKLPRGSSCGIDGDSIGPIRNGNPWPRIYTAPCKIQSDRYGMETINSLFQLLCARFNRTDTEWKHYVSHRSPILGRIQSDRYGMETYVSHRSPILGRIQSDRYGMETPWSIQSYTLVKIQSDRYGMET